MQQLNIKASLFLIAIILFLLANIVDFVPTVNANPEEVIVDSYTVTRTTSCSIIAVYPGTNSNPYCAVGQSFNCSGTYKLTKVSFNIRKLGSPTGFLRARLVKITGTYGVNSRPVNYPPPPYGEVVYETSVDALDMSVLTTTYIWYNFTFSGTYIMTPGYYGVYFYVENASLLNVGNEILVGVVHQSPTHSGNRFFVGSGDGPYGTAWNSNSDIDVLFIVYGKVYVEEWRSVESWNTVFKTPWWHVETWNAIVKTLNWNLVEVFKVVFPYSLMFYMRLSFAFTSCFLILISPALLTYGAKNRNRNIVLAGFILLIFAFVFISLVSNTTNV